MHSKVCSFAQALLFAIGIASSGVSPSLAADLSKVEQIYLDLSKLPPDQRSQNILEGAKKEGRFRFIHSLRGTTGKGQTEAFQRAFPFLDVELTELGSQDAADRLVTEETAGRHLTDLVVVEIADMSEILARNLAARYPTPQSERILKQYDGFKDPENRWIPFEANEHGIVYNTNLVKQPPASYEELCDPKFKGTVSFDPLEVRFLVGLYEVFGRDLARVDRFLKCMSENEPIIQRGHAMRNNLMVAGDHAISPDQYFFTGLVDQQTNPSLPFAVDYQTPVTLAAVSTIINRNAANPYAAALFSDWVLSPEGQAVMAKDLRGPVAAKHPFFPDDAKLVVYTTVSRPIEDALVGMWKKYMNDK